MAINGQAYDWESIEIRLPHGALIDVQAIEYSDELSGSPVYGKGRKPRSFGRGRYSAKGKLTLLREEHDAILAHVDTVNAERAQGGKKRIGILTLPLFPIVASYANDDKPTLTDTLPECQFTTQGTGLKEGDEAATVELEFVCYSPIEWNGRPAC